MKLSLRNVDKSSLVDLEMQSFLYHIWANLAHDFCLRDVFHEKNNRVMSYQHNPFSFKNLSSWNAGKINTFMHTWVELVKSEGMRNC